MPFNIFDRQIFGDLQQFDTITAFVRTIIEPTVSISDLITITFGGRIAIRFITRIKESLSSTTRIKDVEDNSI